jgi:hypothetical protein
MEVNDLVLKIKKKKHSCLMNLKSQTWNQIYLNKFTGLYIYICVCMLPEYYFLK